MRIKSDFTDYYDSVQSFQDPEPLYIRKSTFSKVIHVFNAKDYSKNICASINSLTNIHINSLHKDGKTNDGLQLCSILGVCGDLYLYYGKELVGLLKDYVGNNSGYSLNRIDEHKQLVEETLSPLFNKYRLPVFKVHNTIDRAGNYDITVLTVPNLNKLKFYKVKDAYTIFQDIEFYFNNVLLSTNEPKQITDNIVLRDKKGFDKHSFKHRKPK